jgi:hypothetical protein
MSTEATCEWSCDPDDELESDVWDTACDQKFVLQVGTPADNRFRFCAYCGKPLVWKYDYFEVEVADV